MKTIKVQELSNEKFARYGEYQNLLDDKELAKKSIFPGGFFADVMKLDFGSTTSHRICLSGNETGEDGSEDARSASVYLRRPAASG